MEVNGRKRFYGKYRGTVVNNLDPLQIANFHTQQVTRVRDGTREGLGVLEQVVLGPYAPAGFTGMTDGAKG